MLDICVPVRGVAEDPLEDTGGGVQQARDAIGPGEPGDKYVV